ncbi:tyrosine-type recombinase/integrase [Streptosporangium sp. NPDC050855]|uniref:tyrosine-type recombinase/integrase n=1 Tax=Streptosporangium sp. NPDC050855 TaxID=3366194 RepID=UPI0037B9EB20
MTVYDRWHKSHPKPGDPKCSEHGRTPTIDHGKGERWQVRWRDDRGEQRKRNFTKRSAADTFDAKTKSDLSSGQYVDAARGKIRFREFAEQWRTSQVHRESTVTLVDRALRIHVYPVLGEQTMASVRPGHVQTLIRRCSEELAPSTVHVLYGYVSSIFLAAVRDRVIGHSPCVGIRLPAPETRKITPLDVQTVMALANAVPARYRAIVLTAVGTGLRPSEIFGLEIGKIDLQRRILKVEQQLITSAAKGNEVYLGPPKTPKSHRTIPLSDSVTTILTTHLEEFPAKAVEIIDRTNPRQPFLREAELVFTTSRGTPIKRGTWSDIWRLAADTVGIPQGTGLHVCRHTYASALIRYGESVKTIQHLLGHSSAVTTLNIYAHLWPDADDRARAAVDSVFADVPSMCPEPEAGR